MRTRKSSGSLRVQAIAGTRVVLFGMDVDPGARAGLRGFAIHCQDRTAGRDYWLQNLRIFEANAAAPGGAGLHEVAMLEAPPSPGMPLGDLARQADALVWADEPPATGLTAEATAPVFRSLENPIQAFRWGDYTAKPGHDYTYRVVAMYGDPGALRQGDAVELELRTESPDEGVHGVYFNRGVIASQRYAELFGQKSPDEVPNHAAFTWLSNGLEEAMLAFIAQARGAGFGLRAAVYEFNHAPALDAFAAAARRGVDVKIVYDFKSGNGKPGPSSLAAIQAAGLEDVTIQRTQNPSYISHNKFIVLTQGGRAVAVWTGSTNFTKGGIFGQSNVGHVVRDPRVAARYLDYWGQLSHDPKAPALRTWNEANTPIDGGDDVLPVFSPRGSLDALQRYADLLGGAQQSAFFTAAFGVNQLLLQEMEQPSSALRYVLLEKDGGDVRVIEKSTDDQAAAGAAIDATLGRWIQELDPERHQDLNHHVFYIHDKFMVLDALGDAPVLITGSANFSDASTKNNDENMLVIRGDTRVVDVYLGEFMRLFTHYRFRSFVKSLGGQAADTLRRLSFLDTGDEWSAAAYVPGSHEESERLLFAGTARERSTIGQELAPPPAPEKSTSDDLRELFRALGAPEPPRPRPAGAVAGALEVLAFAPAAAPKDTSADLPVLDAQSIQALRQLYRDQPEETLQRARQAFDRNLDAGDLADALDSVGAALRAPRQATTFLEAVRTLESTANPLPDTFSFEGMDLAAIPIDPGNKKFEEAGDWWGWVVNTGSFVFGYPSGPKAGFRFHDAPHVSSGFVYPLRGQEPGADLTVALFSDFGTGLYHSRYIAKQLAKSCFPYAIHLGDVYYAGRQAEFDENFARYLDPLLDTTRLFTMNGNHEMFSRGVPYFAYLERRLGHALQEQEGSYFCLRGRTAQIIGIDTDYFGYRRFREPSVVAWLEAQLRYGRDNNLTNILLSGDEPYEYGDAGGRTPLFGDLHGLVVERAMVDLWFWGNTHYCALFGPTSELPFIGSCIGHGGFPYGRQKPGRPSPAPVKFVETKGRFPDWTNLRPDRGNNGYCVLTLEAGGGIALRYVDWMSHDRCLARMGRAADGRLTLDRVDVL